MVHKNGAKLFIAFDGKVGYNLNGEFKQTHCILKDITESRKAEKALLESEEKYRTMVDLLPDAIIIHEGGKLVFANAAALKIAGAASFDELIGRSLMDYVHPDFRDGSIERIKQIYSTGQPSKFIEEKFISLKSEIVDVEVLGIPVFYMGNPAIQTIIRDISERKRAEKALQESEEKYSILFKDSPDSYLIILDGIFVDCNKATEAMLRVDRNQIIGQTPEALSPEIQPDGRKSSESAEEKIAFAFEKGKNTFEWMHRRFDGSDFYVEVSIAPMMLKGENTLFTTWRDISARKIAEQALLKSEAQFREFFEKAADAIFIAEFESGIIVDANEAASRLMLRKHNELVGIHQTELHPPVKKNYTNDSFNKHKEQVRNKVTSYAIENILVRADGNEVPVEILASQVEYQGKRCLMGTFRDITERKRASDALMNSLSLTEATLESIHNGILVVDHEGRVIKTSSQFAEMWQIPENILASGDDKTIMEYILDQLIDPGEFVSRVKELYAKPEAESNDLIEFKDGRVFERVSKPMYLEGKPKGRVWSFLDISERMRAEVELKESQALYFSLVEQLPNPVFRKDREGRFTLVNSQFCKLKGLSVDNYIGFTAQEVADRELADLGKHGHATKYFAEGEDVHKQILQTGKIFEHEEEYFYDDGRKQYFHVLRMPVVDSTNKIIGTQGIMFDVTERKLAEQARSESYDFNQSLLKTIPFGMNIVDEYGTILFQNKNFENVFGKEAVGGKCWELYRDDKCQCHDCPLHKGIEVGETAIYESKGVLGGRIFEISHTGMMFKGKKAMLEIFQDITDRKRVEVEMRNTKKLLEQTFEQSPVPMVLVSMPDMVIRVVNPACRSFLGIDDEVSWINTSLMEINPTWQDYDMNGKQTSIEDLPLTKSLMGKQTIGEERYIVRKDGIMRYELANSFPIYNDQDEIIAATLIMIDITERKKAEEVISESAKLFKDLFNASPDAIILIDTRDPNKSWPIVDCNEVACRMNGYTREEMIGQTIDMLHIKAGSPEERANYLKDLKEKGILQRENLHRHKDGHIFPIESSTSIVTIGGQKMVLGIDRDITDRKQIEFDLISAKEKAQESDRLKSAFLANMSHEIRTPLNSIIGFSELILDPDFDTEQTSTFAEIIHSNGNSLLNIISDIMDISKIESGQFKLDIKSVSAQDLLNNLQKEFSLKANEKGIDFRLAYSEIKGDLNFETDENKLKQVLRNFIVNAIKFTEKGFVEAGVEIIDKYLQFHIKDTGIGIPEEYHKSVFERFIQVESPNSRKYGGNGLGLAISKSLIEALGGTVWLESEPGVGSTFYFTIPKIEITAI